MMKTQRKDLAVFGGPRTITEPLPTHSNRTGRLLGDEELAQVAEVLESGTLAYIYGTKVHAFERAFGDVLGVPNVVATSSGTASLHAAMIYLNTEPGSEVLVSPITDMGTIIPILYQVNIPVFVDIDEDTFNINPLCIEERISERTRVIIVTHIFGAPCDMDPILSIARRHNLAVIEDCAQAYLAQYKGRYVGTLGTVGCFSLQQSKHITTGDGGFVVAIEEKAYGRELRLCADKGWPRSEWREHLFLAPNYHMTELQAAVGLAQLKKLKSIVETRRRTAEYFSILLRSEVGINPQKVASDCVATYFAFTFRIDPKRYAAPVAEMVQAMAAEGVPAHCGYLDYPIYRYTMLRDKITFGRSGFPLRGQWGSRDYPEGLCPVAEKHCAESVYIVWNEGIQESHVEQLAAAVKKVLGYYRHD